MADAHIDRQETLKYLGATDGNAKPMLGVSEGLTPVDPVALDRQVSEREAAEEAEQITVLEKLLGQLQTLQRLFLVSIPKDQIGQAAGRRAILVIKGLKYTKKSFYFEVTERGVTVVAPFEHFNTAIAAPIESVIRVLSGVLNGDTTAFTAEKARNKVQIIGQRSVHDAIVFDDVFKRLARMIQRYQKK